MNNEKRGNAWKTASIVLAVLILLVTISGIFLVLFGQSSSNDRNNPRTKAELVITLPDAEAGKGKDKIQIKGAEPVAPANTTTDGHRYEIINTRVTWEQAKDYCLERGGHLATVTSPDEYQMIVNLANKSERKVLWLGAVKGADQSFKWVTGESVTYTNWLAGEPNNEGGNENCLVMFDVQGGWVWADVPNDLSPYYGADKVGFVCEYE